MKLQLPTVTLICVDCVDPDRAQKVLNHCVSMADFGAVKLLTHPEIPELKSLIAYSIFMLTKVHEHIDTDHVLVVQRDGWILNPESFDPAWLDLDYIGPLFVQYDKVGSGGFSLRSKRVMNYTASILPAWDGTQAGAENVQDGLSYYEDGVITLGKASKRFKIANNSQAAAFAQGGNRNPAYFRERPFGFHRTWQQIDFTTGRVDSSDKSRDLQSSYHHEIDKL